MANTVIKHQPSTAGSNRYKYTISGWFKRSKLTDREMFLRFDASSGGYFFFEFKSDDTIGFNDYDGGATGRCEYQVTSRKFRDTNAYYHLVLTVDSTETSSSDRVKIWVNGELQTIQSNGSEVCPINYQTYATSGALQYVGGDGRYTTRYYNGVISHLHFCEGYAYDASDFGSTDATTGEWKINTSPSVTYGTNGFFLFKDDNSLTDRSGQGNDFSTHSGTLTKTEDNPSNVFCTLNPLIRFSSNPTLSTGNLSIDENGATWQSSASTLGVSQGKWYYEYKAETAGGSGLLHKLGFMSEQLISAVGHMADTTVDGGYGWYTNDNGEVRTDSAVISGWSASDITNITSITAGDVLKIAIDMDNKFAYFGVNNVWAKNGDPTSGSSGTGGLDISADYPSGKILIPAVSVYNGCTGSINFGNGYFGTTAVSSAGTNASGIGIFEHDVPENFTALSTKGLNL